MPALSLIDQTVEAFWAEGIRDVGVIQANHPLTNMIAEAPGSVTSAFSGGLGYPTLAGRTKSEPCAICVAHTIQAATGSMARAYVIADNKLALNTAAHCSRDCA